MVVMKFGGTSVADRAAIERLMAIVRAERQAEAQREGGDPRGPIVVVSALSGVTDRLLGLAAQAGAGDTDGARVSVRDLHQRHITVVRGRHRRGARERAAGGTGARVRRAGAHRLGPGGAARGVAALDGHHRRRRRDPQQPDRRGRAQRRRAAGDVGGRAAGARHQRRPPGRRAAVSRDHRRTDGAGRSRCWPRVTSR